MDQYNRKYLLIAVVVITGLIIAIILAFTYFNSRNPYGEELKISNLGNYTSGKANDPDRERMIRHVLFKTINYNLKKKIGNNSIDDVVVRDKTFSQKRNSETGIYTVKFIVDIASLKQSYQVSYQWNPDPDSDERVDEYGTQVTCLPLDLLRYGDFNCVDERALEQGDNYDEVDTLLPHIVEYKYTIKRYTVIQESDKVALHVEAFVPSYIDEQTTLDQYSTEIKEWLKSKKLDPDKYYFEFIY